MKTPLAILFSLLTLYAFAAEPPSSPWRQPATAGEAGYDAAALEEVRALADRVQSAAVVVTDGGRVIAAWGTVERKFELHSVRKSLYAALWGIAEARGLVKLDATLAELGVDDLEPLTPAEKKARLIDLLQARSGVYHRSAYSPGDMDKGLPQRGSHEAGTFWYYNNWDFNVAGALLERFGGKPLGQLFDEWIAKPVGMEDYAPGDVYAVHEPGTSRWPALTFRMSARDLARFGQLWLDGGRWNGRQIIPAAWIESASAAASNTGRPGQGYGAMWWTYDKGSLDADRYPHASKVRTVAGRGTGGQFVAVVPSRRLVFVHRTDTDHGRNVGGSDVWTILDRILGAKTKSPAQDPQLIALRPEPLASALPPFEWPSTINLQPEAIAPLIGEYALGPGMNVKIFLYENRLYVFMPGRGEAEMFAVTPREFYVRVDPTVRIHFETADDGAVTAIRATMRGREMTARRVAGDR